MDLQEGLKEVRKHIDKMRDRVDIREREIILMRDGLPGHPEMRDLVRLAEADLAQTKMMLDMGTAVLKSAPQRPTTDSMDN